MKKVLALLFALLLALGVAAGAAADIPDKPGSFAYAYDFTGKVLSSANMEEITRYGAALEEATGTQTIAVVVDFLDGEDPAACARLAAAEGAASVASYDALGGVLPLDELKRKIAAGWPTREG